MKVLFLKDVARVAHAGDIRDVKNGYGRNYLLPQGLAVIATKDTVARSDGLRKSAEERRLKEAADWQEVAEALVGMPVEIEAQSGPTGRLYGSVTNTVLAAALSQMTGREIDRRGVRFREPVRQTGDYSVPVRLHEGIEVEIKLLVRAEGSDGAPEAQEADEPTEQSTDDSAPPAVEETPEDTQSSGS